MLKIDQSVKMPWQIGVVWELHAPTDRLLAISRASSSQRRQSTGYLFPRFALAYSVRLALWLVCSIVCASVTTFQNNNFFFEFSYCSLSCNTGALVKTLSAKHVQLSEVLQFYVLIKVFPSFPKSLFHYPLIRALNKMASTAVMLAHLN